MVITRKKEEETVTASQMATRKKSSGDSNTSTKRNSDQRVSRNQDPEKKEYDTNGKEILPGHEINSNVIWKG